MLISELNYVSFVKQGAFIIHCLDFLRIILFGHESLQLHRAAHKALREERLWFEINVFSLFKTHQATLLTDAVHFLAEYGSHVFVLTYLLEGAFDRVLFGQLEKLIFGWYHHSDCKVVK